MKALKYLVWSHALEKRVEAIDHESSFVNRSIKDKNE